MAFAVRLRRNSFQMSDLFSDLAVDMESIPFRPRTSSGIDVKVPPPIAAPDPPAPTPAPTPDVALAPAAAPVPSPQPQDVPAPLSLPLSKPAQPLTPALAQPPRPASVDTSMAVGAAAALMVAMGDVSPPALMVQRSSSMPSARPLPAAAAAEDLAVDALAAAGSGLATEMAAAVLLQPLKSAPANPLNPPVARALPLPAPPSPPKPAPAAAPAAAPASLAGAAAADPAAIVPVSLEGGYAEGKAAKDKDAERKEDKILEESPQGRFHKVLPPSKRLTESTSFARTPRLSETRAFVRAKSHMVSPPLRALPPCGFARVPVSSTRCWARARSKRCTRRTTASKAARWPGIRCSSSGCPKTKKNESSTR